MTERFAIYYAPSANSPLWDRAAAWLGRDASSGGLFDGPVAGIERNRLLNLTQSANRYGFHATLKPPLTLAPARTLGQLRAELAEFAAGEAPIALGALHIAALDGFLALVSETENAALKEFATRVVERFEPFRAPLSAKERAARAVRGLTPRQEELLDAYGYPYVLDEFYFHLTLTDRLAEQERDEIAAAARGWFGALLGEEVVLDRLVLFHQAGVGRNFTRLEDFKLGG